MIQRVSQSFMTQFLNIYKKSDLRLFETVYWES
jgi:hypothetical protein